MVFRAFICAAALALLAGCASGSSKTTATSLPPPDPLALAAVGSVSEYRIGPMDVLDIVVFQAPELSRPSRVDATGHIALPLVGSVLAAGRTQVEVQDAIAEELRRKYMQSPEVSVTVKEFASQRITVDGSVSAPGVYPLAGRTTLMQAIALAKGADRLANQRDVVVFRTVNGQRMGAKFDLVAIREGTQEDPQVYADDVIIVDRSGTRSVVREIIGTLPLVNIFRPLIF